MDRQMLEQGNARRIRPLEVIEEQNVWLVFGKLAPELKQPVEEIALSDFRGTLDGCFEIGKLAAQGWNELRNLRCHISHCLS